MHTYNQKLIPRAREMRKNQTASEQLLWQVLRTLPYKFRRQRPFGHFIVDFYCPAVKLVVEVDGDSHFTDEAKAYDAERTAYLQGLGLLVVRFTNIDVFRQRDVVVAEIMRLCDGRIDRS
jgi:very-short-patch-repair endonuclease